MIGIDMKMPNRCCECPMSYWIQMGEYEDQLMCEAIEKQLIEQQDPYDLETCLVNDPKSERPQKCPLIDLSLKLVKEGE